MRLALLSVLVPGLVSALAPNLTVLVAARALTGGLFAAVIPASLVYIGDTVPIETRHKALGDQLATSALATALATAAAGAAAYSGLWRLAFAAPVSWPLAFWGSSSPGASPNLRETTGTPGRSRGSGAS